MGELSIETRQVERGVVLDICGEIDINTAMRLRERLEAHAGAERLALNLTGVPFIDSTGLGMLVAVWNQRGNPDRAIRLFGVCDSVRRAFQVTALDRVFPLCASEADALSN